MDDRCPHCGVGQGEIHGVFCPLLPKGTFGSLRPYVVDARAPAPASTNVGMVAPESIAAAENHMAELLQDIEAIDLQLSNKDRKANGERMTAEAYHSWRHRALTAKNAKRREYAWLKGWLDAQDRARQAAWAERAGIAPEGPEALLGALYRATSGWIDEGRLTLTPEDMRLLKRVAKAVPGVSLSP